jgi:hypothetical protein
MRPDPFKRLQTHSRITASDYNRLADTVSRIASANGPGIYNDSTGFGIRQENPDRVYAKITGNNNEQVRKYSWVEVYLDAEGEFQEKSDGIVGSTTAGYAIERHNVLVGDGLIVELNLIGGLYWEFELGGLVETLQVIETAEENDGYYLVRPVYWRHDPPDWIMVGETHRLKVTNDEVLDVGHRTVGRLYEVREFDDEPCRIYFADPSPMSTSVSVVTNVLCVEGQIVVEREDLRVLVISNTTDLYPANNPWTGQNSWAGPSIFNGSVTYGAGSTVTAPNGQAGLSGTFGGDD